MATAKVFRSGNSQAVRLPWKKDGAHYVLNEVAAFKGIEEMLEWLAVHGRAAPEGQAAWAQGNWN